MAKINLLPTDIRPSAQAIRFAGIAQKIAVAYLTLFLLFGGGLIGLFVFNSYQIKDLAKKEDGLKAIIIANQDVEQKTFLIKDRVRRVSNILATDNSEKLVEKFAWFGQNLPNGVAITNLSFSGGEIKEVLLAGNSLAVKDLFAQIPLAKSDFATIDLLSLNYSVQQGYVVSFGYTFK